MRWRQSRAIEVTERKRLYPNDNCDMPKVLQLLALRRSEPPVGPLFCSLPLEWRRRLWYVPAQRRRVRSVRCLGDLRRCVDDFRLALAAANRCPWCEAGGSMSESRLECCRFRGDVELGEIVLANEKLSKK